jgi:hypothetical protein
MRRFDKKTNITKANILAEQRHITEGISQRDIQILIDAQNSIRDIQYDSIFAGKLSLEEMKILTAAGDICKTLETRLMNGTKI